MNKIKVPPKTWQQKLTVIFESDQSKKILIERKKKILFEVEKMSLQRKKILIERTKKILLQVEKMSLERRKLKNKL